MRARSCALVSAHSPGSSGLALANILARSFFQVYFLSDTNTDTYKDTCKDTYKETYKETYKDIYREKFGLGVGYHDCSSHVALKHCHVIA